MGPKLKELRAEYEEYSKRLPGEKEIPEFLEGLASIAKTSKVKILSITPSELVPVEVEGKKEGYYKEMPISITAKSGYHQLGRFVADIETGKRFITISDINIRYDSNTPRMHNVKMGLKTRLISSPHLGNTSRFGISRLAVALRIRTPHPNLF